MIKITRNMLTESKKAYKKRKILNLIFKTNFGIGGSLKIFQNLWRISSNIDIPKFFEL